MSPAGYERKRTEGRRDIQAALVSTRWKAGGASEAGIAADPPPGSGLF